jgi:hypothetical protein
MKRMLSTGQRHAIADSLHSFATDAEETARNLTAGVVEGDYVQMRILLLIESLNAARRLVQDPPKAI